MPLVGESGAGTRRSEGERQNDSHKRGGSAFNLRHADFSEFVRRSSRLPVIRKSGIPRRGDVLQLYVGMRTAACVVAP